MSAETFVGDLQSGVLHIVRTAQNAMLGTVRIWIDAIDEMFESVTQISSTQQEFIASVSDAVASAPDPAKAGQKTTREKAA